MNYGRIDGKHLQNLFKRLARGKRLDDVHSHLMGDDDYRSIWPGQRDVRKYLPYARHDFSNRLAAGWSRLHRMIHPECMFLRIGLENLWQRQTFPGAQIYFVKPGVSLDLKGMTPCRSFGGAYRPLKAARIDHV